MATRGPNSFFILCALQSRVFSGSSSHSHRIFIGPRTRVNLFCHSLLTFVATGWPTSFFLCVLLTRQFSIDLCQIHTKYLLGHGVDLSILSSPIIKICCLFLCNSPEQNFQWIFFKFSPIFTGPRSRLLSIFVIH